MPISFPRNIELRSQRLERQPILLWLEDYEEGMAILMHIGIENRFGYLNRFFRKGGGRRKNDGLAGYLDAIPKNFRISVTPKESSTCLLRWIELLSGTFVLKTTTEGEVSDRIVELDARRRTCACRIRLYRRDLGTRCISISFSAHGYPDIQPIFAHMNPVHSS